ncbi:MAG TPA: L-seryl-tRNA(Sec) selenium transferase [Actinomycetota bacterium]|nr:L-seryl-tRNA(Sec) selenium transferase [Actinomycetota bacterium]
MSENAFRALPSVEKIAAALRSHVPPSVATAVARGAIDDARSAIGRGESPPSHEEVLARARELLESEALTSLQPVINATGVLIHTNLGRVPLGSRQLDEVRRIVSGYSNLEYELEAGSRGSRYGHARSRLARLTGAEDALVVNNNAAAVLLVLSALAAGKEVIISRGELIEIGGEFRIPEILAESGARLVEVGTTNRTHLADYERAIHPETGLILKVHPSNYRVVGFTASVEAQALAKLARGRGVCFVHDIGSGLLAAPEDVDWIQGEPSVERALAEGADLVTFSGDKLLGGPQAGLIAGRRELIAQVSRHPLLRALRVDKMTLAALEATLDLYLSNDLTAIPVWALATATSEELEGRAKDLARHLSEQRTEVKAEAIPVRSVAGGGSLPETDLSSWGVALSHATKNAGELARALRTAPQPVVARVEDDRVVIDLRTVFPDQDPALLESLLHALR